MLENWEIVQFFKQTHTHTHSRTLTQTPTHHHSFSLSLSLSLRLRSTRLGYSHLCTGRKTRTFSYATGHIGSLSITSAGRVKRERGGRTFFIHNCVLYLPALSLRECAFVQICPPRGARGELDRRNVTTSRLVGTNRPRLWRAELSY